MTSHGYPYFPQLHHEINLDIQTNCNNIFAPAAPLRYVPSFTKHPFYISVTNVAFKFLKHLTLCILTYIATTFNNTIFEMMQIINYWCVPRGGIIFDFDKSNDLMKPYLSIMT